MSSTEPLEKLSPCALPSASLSPPMSSSAFPNPPFAPATLALHADKHLHTSTASSDVAPPIHVSTNFSYPDDPEQLIPAREMIVSECDLFQCSLSLRLSAHSPEFPPLPHQTSLNDFSSDRLAPDLSSIPNPAARLLPRILTQHNAPRSRARQPARRPLCDLRLGPSRSSCRLRIPSPAADRDRAGVLRLARRD
jgi:hypothetical protein